MLMALYPRSRAAFRILIIATLALASVLGAVGNPLFAATSAEAQVGQTTPPPEALALPAQLFPPGSLVRESTPTNTEVDRTTGLHTVPLDQLGRVNGYEQAAW